MNISYETDTSMDAHERILKHSSEELRQWQALPLEINKDPDDKSKDQRVDKRVRRGQSIH